MADTIDEVTLTDGWQSANQISGLAVGTSMVIQNQGEIGVYLRKANSQPSASAKGTIIPITRDRPIFVPEGESEVWLRPTVGIGTAIVSIQED